MLLSFRRPQHVQGKSLAAKIISVMNFKGGVGKTTLSVNIAACLAQDFHKRVLLVDLDAQANASIWVLGAARWHGFANSMNMIKTSFGLFRERVRRLHVVRPYGHPEVRGGFLPDFWIIPASYHLIETEEDIRRKKDLALIEQRYIKDSEYKYLLGSIGPLKRTNSASGYDYVIYDTPPNLYSVTRNALFSSDYLLIPCIPDALSTFGLKLLIRQTSRIVQVLRRPPVLLGVIVSKRKRETEHEKGTDQIHSVVDSMRQRPEFPCVDDRTVVFDDYPVRERADHTKAVSEGKPLCLFRPHSEAYHDIVAVTQAMLDAVEARS